MTLVDNYSGSIYQTLTIKAQWKAFLLSTIVMGKLSFGKKIPYVEVSQLAIKIVT